MSRKNPPSDWVIWALVCVLLLPFAVGDMVTWVLLDNPAQRVGGWVLALSGMALVTGLGLLRIQRARRLSSIGVKRAILAASPSLVTIGACLLIPAVGFRWAFTLLMGAMAGQAFCDFAGSAMPSCWIAIRPVLTIGALIAVLIGFVGI